MTNYVAAILLCSSVWIIAQPGFAEGVGETRETDSSGAATEGPAGSGRNTPATLTPDWLDQRLSVVGKGFYLRNPGAGKAKRQSEALGRLRLRTELHLPSNIEGLVDVRGNLRRSERIDADTNVEGELTQAWISKTWATTLTEPTLKVGRSRLREERGWWWDDSFESVRLQFHESLFKVEVGIGERLMTGDIDDDIRREVRDDLTWVFGSVSHEWHYRHFVESRFLVQLDRGRVPPIGSTLSNNDPTNEDLTWIGVRAMGRQPRDKPAAPVWTPPQYWADLAWTTGRETRLDLDLAGRVSGRHRRNVSGFGLDTGMVFEAPYGIQANLGYAFATKRFRQPDLQRNRTSFSNLNRFRYYGEVFRPNLSNLHILTAGLGIPVASDFWAQAMFHKYWQVDASTRLLGVGIDTPARGRKADLGESLDLIFGRDFSKIWSFELLVGAMRYGPAFGGDSGKFALRGGLELRRHFRF